LNVKPPVTVLFLILAMLLAIDRAVHANSTC